jgi:hypothetical protein
VDRLLILSCSQRKATTKDRLPAIDRYDGPAFRVLRKYLREAPPVVPVVLILSAKYGLIAADRRIEDYDCRLTASAAARLRPKVLEAVRRVLDSGEWSSVGVCASKVYRIALDGLSELMHEGARLDLIEGGQGPRLTNLRAWLHQRE